MARNRSEKHPFPTADKEARAFLRAYTRWAKGGGSAGPVIDSWDTIPHTARQRITGGTSIPFRDRFNTLESLIKTATPPT